MPFNLYSSVMNQPSKQDLPEQVPTFLEKMDDPYGITWRIVNKIKRFDLSRSYRFLSGLGRTIHYQRPIFVLGTPRSGTTMLFRILQASSQLASLPREGHDLWRTYHHPRNSHWRSDVVNKGDVGWGEPRFVNAYLYSYFGEHRFVEKTPENCLRVPYILELFPDALFVVIKRNPCDVINSLINGWKHPKGKYRSYFVPEDLNIVDYSKRRQWCFLLVEGWQNYTASSVAEIAFNQWLQCTQKIIEARQLVASDRWLEIHLEDLLSRPNEVLEKVCHITRIENETKLKAKTLELVKNPVNALTPPEKNKWKNQNLAEISKFLPRISAAALESGYIVDSKTGEFQLKP